MTGLLDELGMDRVKAIMAEAVAEAAQESDALGLPRVLMLKGRPVRQYLDGRIEAIEVPTQPQCRNSSNS